MSTIIRTHVSDKAEQFTLDGVHYVGRRVLEEDGYHINDVGPCGRILFRLDYSKGDIFVDPALLRPFPDEPIEEPGK